MEHVLTTVAEQAVDLIRASASLVYLHRSQHRPAASRRRLQHPDRVSRPDGCRWAKMSQATRRRPGAPSSSITTAAWEERTHSSTTPRPDGILTTANCAAAIPLIYNRQVLGVLEILYNDGREITNKDVALLQLITPHAATAMSHAQLFERSQQVMNLLEIINDRGAAVSSVSTAVINAGHNLKKMSDETLTRTVAALRLAAGQVYLKRTRRRSVAHPIRSTICPTKIPAWCEWPRTAPACGKPSCCKTWPRLPGRTTLCSGWPSAAWARWWPCR